YTVVNSVGGELNRSEKYTDAVKVFEAAAKAIEKESNRNFTHNAILSAYATALIKSGDVQKGIELTKASIERAGARASAGDYQNLSAAYQALGRDLDAFQAIDNFLTSGNFNSQLAASLEPLYNKLNNNKGDFKSYLADLNGR